MRTADPFEPEVEAALEAIDATLAGEPVDPEHAELAELALILRADRPPVAESFAAAMDARVGDRFAATSRRRARPWRRPRRGFIVWAPAGALAAVALVVALVTFLPGGSSSSSSSSDNSFATSSTAAAASAAPAAPGRHSDRSSAGPAATASSAASASATTAAPPVAPPTAPSTGNRQVVQSARLALSARPDKVDAVAQQVFDVVGSEKGYVANSSVTSTGDPDSGANFQLSVPSANLQPTLIALAQLPGATVVSSTSASNDITGQVGGAGRRLAEARALLRSLLGRLATADTSEQIDSLKAQIRDANAVIDRDQAALSGLHRQVQYSRIALTIQGTGAATSGGVGGSGGSGGSGFTLHRAAHDAVRVLVVAAGVLLIALAVAIPLALVGALLAWLWLRLRRHRRESALDRA